MSTDEVAQQWENVRNTKSPVRWVISAVNDKANGLTLIASGTTGLSGFLEALGDVNGIIHAGLKVTGVDERGSVKSIRSQFVKVTMMTDDVPQLKRAKALQLKDAIDRAFSGANVVVDVSSADEIRKDDLERRLASAAGAHKPGRYDFEGVEDDLQTTAGSLSPRNESQSPRREKSEDPSPKTVDAAPAAATAVTEKQGATPSSEAPAAAAAAPAPAPAPAPKAQPAAPVVEEGPLTIESAWLKVHDEKHPYNYLVVTFDGKDPKSAEILAVGSGDLEAFKSHLVDDKPIYAGFRLRAIDDRGSVVSVRSKIIFVSMIGKNVKPVVRAQAGAVKTYFDSMFSGHHVPVFVESASELTEADIVQRLRQSGGAHQPNRYDFSGKKGQDV